MEAVINASGEIVNGEIVNGALCVQHGPDFDPTFTVYMLDEITRAPVEEPDDFPTELDNTFCDADMEARQNIAETLAENEEAEKLRALLVEFIEAGTAYLQSVDKAMGAVEYAAFDYWEGKEGA